MCTILMVIAVCSLCTSVVLGQPEPPSDDFNVTPNEIVERPGVRAQIDCIYIYTPAPTTRIQWGVEKAAVSQFIPPDNSTNNIKVSADSRTLIFDPVSQGQEGNYFCWVPLSNTETVYSRVVPLTILREPVVTNKDKPNGQVTFNYNLAVRTPARLNFTTSGSPTPTLTLYKKDQSMRYVEFTSERFTVNLVGIIISSVEPEDEDEYRLTAAYETNLDSEEFTISVNNPPVAPRLMLEVLNSTATEDTRVLARIGSRVAISCRMTEAYTGGNLQVYWSSTTQTTDFSVRQSLTEVHLIIDTVYRENAGIYNCHAVNNIDAALLPVNLVVGSVPEPFRITVTASNNNSLSVVWEGNTTKPYDERILAHYVQYRAVNYSDTGVVVEKFAASVQTATIRNVEHGVEYLVSIWGENFFGNSSESNEVSVIIIFMDDYSISPQEIIQPINTTATISCVYKPAPDRAISWGVEKSGFLSFILPDNLTNNIQVSADTRTLIFNPISQGQEGNYFCWIPTSTEDVYSTVVPFIILCEPVIVNKDRPSDQIIFTYNLIVQKSARLNITTDGSPTPELTLYKRTRPAGDYVEFNSERFNVSLIGLMISSVEPEDEGEYRLTATYENYHDSEEFTITVINEPIITNEDKPSDQIIFTYNLTAQKSARLNITSDGRPTPELTLYNRSQPAGDYVEFNSDRFNVSLVGIMISSVEPEDEGEYRLTATYENYHDSEEFTITVINPEVKNNATVGLAAGVHLLVIFCVVAINLVSSSLLEIRRISVQQNSEIK